jgi:flagellar P-ring protein precursor FlgI
LLTLQSKDGSVNLCEPFLHFRRMINLLNRVSVLGILVLSVLVFSLSFAKADRLKDMTSIAGVRSNQLVGYGLVVGLAGSGDGNAVLTQQAMQSMISQFGVVTSAANMNGKNAASVIVTADLPPFIKPGQKLDVVVSTVGQAKSLRGGTLLMTPLLGADGETYAIAQGNLMVGGLGVTGGDGSSLTVNVPTVGRIPGGGSVERMIETSFLENENILLNLHQGDFSTSGRVAEAINDVFGAGVATALDSTSIKVRAPINPAEKVSFVSLLENIQVTPDRPRAKVVVNARTGTIVIGGDVRILPAAVTHGSLTVRVNEDQQITQTQAIAVAGGVAATVPGAAVAAADTTIEANEEFAKSFIFDPGVKLSSIVDALNAVGGTPSDLVAILEALREAGSLRAELIII